VLIKTATSGSEWYNEAAEMRKVPDVSSNYQHLLKDLKRAEKRSQIKINPHQKLSLCMIVKNEEAYLADCLNSVQGIVDEIIVVDTGSTDRTVEIAREHGARVFFKEWEDDFSKARNESLKHATGDWILVLDADERIPEGYGDNLRSLLIPTEQPLSYLTYIKNYTHEQEESSVIGHYIVRMFKRTPETTYFGVIHEQVYPNWGSVTIPESTFYLVHLGYGKLQQKADKIETRNLPLTDKALAETKETNPSLYSFYAYYKGAALTDAAEMKKWMEESISHCPDPHKAEHIPVAYLDYMRAHYYLQEFEAGVEAGREALAKNEGVRTYADFWDFYGIMLLHTQRYDEAIEAFQQALKYGDINAENAMFFAARTNRIGGWGTLLNLGLTCALKGDQLVAEDWFRKALDAYPTEDRSLLMARIDKIMGSPDLTTQYLEESLKAESGQTPHNIKMLSNAYLKQEKPFEAILLQHRLHDSSKVVEAALKLAVIYEQYQRLELAAQIYKGLLTLDADLFAARLGLRAIELLQAEQTPDASELQSWSEQAQTGEDFVLLGQFCLRFRELDAAETAFVQAQKNVSEPYQIGLYLALVAQEKQAFEQAVALLKDLIQTAPERSDAYTQLGNLLLFLGEFSQAEVMFREVKTLEQEAPGWYAFYALGLALAGQDRFDEAKTELEQAKQLSPQQTAPQNILDMIAQAEAQTLETSSSN